MNGSWQGKPGANPGRRGGKPATNLFSYDAAEYININSYCEGTTNTSAVYVHCWIGVVTNRILRGSQRPVAVFFSNSSFSASCAKPSQTEVLCTSLRFSLLMTDNLKILLFTSCHFCWTVMRMVRWQLYAFMFILYGNRM
jgi:hypothetical protein